MLLFDFWGFTVGVRAFNSPSNAKLLENLQFDFSSYVVSDESTECNVLIEIEEKMKKPAVRVLLFSTRLCKRFFHYPGIHFEGPNDFCARLDFLDPRKIEMHVSNCGTDYTHEFLFSYILSVVGEEMDKRGFHRIHGFSFRTSKTAMVVPLPTGRGKSSMISWILKNTNARCLGDETLFTDGQVLLPFLVRRALSKDSIGHEANRPSAKLKRIGAGEKLLFGWPDGASTQMEEDFRIALFGNVYTKMQFAWTFFWGIGNSQMIEFFLRLNNLYSLFKIAVSRLRVAIRLIQLVEVEPLWSQSSVENWHNLTKTRPDRFIPPMELSSRVK